MLRCRVTRMTMACTQKTAFFNNRRKTRSAGLGLFGRNRMRLIHNLSGNNIVADDHRLEVCVFAVPRLFRNLFLSGVTRTSTVSSVTMYVP